VFGDGRRGKIQDTQLDTLVKMRGKKRRHGVHLRPESKNKKQRGGTGKGEGGGVSNIRRSEPKEKGKSGRPFMPLRTAWPKNKRVREKQEE